MGNWNIVRNDPTYPEPLDPENEKTWMMHPEGCLSFERRPMIAVPRYRIIKARYTLVNNNGVKWVGKNLHDMTAFVMQHETDHFDLKYIYDEDKD